LGTQHIISCIVGHCCHFEGRVQAVNQQTWHITYQTITRHNMCKTHTRYITGWTVYNQDKRNNSDWKLFNSNSAVQNRG